MDNHIHLIAIPKKEDSLAKGIGDTHKYYTRMVNFRENWRGYLWQGRFSSFPLDEKTGGLLEESAGFFEKAAAEKEISLDYTFPKNQVNIFIDAERINQVVSNLINNAIKFTEQGGKIRVEVKVMENKVRVGVTDTGIGISKQDLNKLFHKFTQVSKSAEAPRQGGEYTPIVFAKNIILPDSFFKTDTKVYSLRKIAILLNAGVILNVIL